MQLVPDAPGIQGSIPLRDGVHAIISVVAVPFVAMVVVHVPVALTHQVPHPILGQQAQVLYVLDAVNESEHPASAAFRAAAFSPATWLCGMTFPIPRFQIPYWQDHGTLAKQYHVAADGSPLPLK